MSENKISKSALVICATRAAKRSLSTLISPTTIESFSLIIGITGIANQSVNRAFAI